MNKINLEKEDNISLVDIIEKLKEIKNIAILYRLKLGIIILTGALIGLTYSLVQKTTYTATLTFAMEEEKGGGASGGLSAAAGIASQFGLDLGTNSGGVFASTNIIELMKSRKLIEKALLYPVEIEKKKTTLAQFYLEVYFTKEELMQNERFKSIQFLPNQDRKDFNLRQNDILNDIYKFVVKEILSISQKDKKVTIITMNVVSLNETFSHLFIENLAKLTSDFYIETKSKKAKSNVDILQKQADSVKTELVRAIFETSSESDNVYNLNPAINSMGTKVKAKQINVQANTAILTQLVGNLELAKVTLRKETPLIQIIDRPILPLEKNKISKIITVLLFSFLFGVFSLIYLFFKEIILINLEKKEI